MRLAISCLLAQGHLLIEDTPGMGKSTLAEALARGVGLSFKRVSFTSDLLPADLTGLNFFDQRQSDFRFQPGPLFTQVLLADEINRASPRTQSALLEAMAAARVSVDGTSHVLPEPFFVIATQNSLDQVGTSPLPEAQLDRFLMRLSLGHPDRAAERALLMGQSRALENVQAVLTPERLQALQSQVASLHCSDAIDRLRPGSGSGQSSLRGLVCPPVQPRPCWRRLGRWPCCRAVTLSRSMTSRPCSQPWRNTAWTRVPLREKAAR